MIHSTGNEYASTFMNEPVILIYPGVTKNDLDTLMILPSSPGSIGVCFVILSAFGASFSDIFHNFRLFFSSFFLFGSICFSIFFFGSTLEKKSRPL